MADQNLGVLYTPIEARLQPLEQGIKRAEGIAREGAKRIEKASEVDIGRQRGAAMGAGGGGGGLLDFGLKIGAGIQGAGVAFTGLNAAVSFFKGDVEAARAAIFQMPLGLGQVARAFDNLLDVIEGPLDGLTDIEMKQGQIAKRAKDDLRDRAIERRRGLGAEAGLAGLEGTEAQRAQVDAERKQRLAKLADEQREAFKMNVDMRKDFAAEREQIEEIASKKIEAINRKEAEQKEKIAEEASKRQEKELQDQMKLESQRAEQVMALRDQNDIAALRQTDAAAADRLQIEKDAEQAIRRATSEGNASLIPEIERQKALRLAGIGGGAGSARQIDDISRMVLGSGAGMQRVGQDEPPASKKQADTQIGVLRDMLNAITRLKLEATAN
jgi:hypothetical protein